MDKRLDYKIDDVLINIKDSIITLVKYGIERYQGDENFVQYVVETINEEIEKDLYRGRETIMNLLYDEMNKVSDSNKCVESFMTCNTGRKV